MPVCPIALTSFSYHEKDPHCTAGGSSLHGGDRLLSLTNKPHVNLTNAKSDIAVDAKTLLEEYQRDEAASNEKYFDKVIAVKGIVTEVMNDEGTVKVSLETGDPNGFVVRCELSATAPHAAPNLLQENLFSSRVPAAGLTLMCSSTTALKSVKSSFKKIYTT
jgi:hypothetical protein